MNGDGQITVSRDALRAELGELELRLVKTLATSESVTKLETRVSSLERWRAYLTGAVAVALGVAGFALKLYFGH